MRSRLFWPLTGRGTGALVVAASAFAVASAAGVGELVYVGVLLVALVVAGALSLLTTHRYGEVTRAFAPDVTAVGEEGTVTVRARSRGGLPAGAARWRDVLPPGIEGDAEGVLPFGDVDRGVDRDVARTVDRGSDNRGDTGLRVTYTIRAARRGIREVGPFQIVATDPFGVARRRVRVGGTASVTVTAATLALPPLAEFPGEAGGSLHTATHQLGEGADNLIPRAYLPGDSMRRINWRASAHHAELMVRQEEQESTPEATVVLDRSTHRWGSAATAPGEDDGFETAVTAALSAVSRLSREGYDVLIVDAEGVEVAAPVTAGDLAALDAVALETATLVAGGEDHLPTLAARFAGTVAGPVVVITGALSVADVDALAAVVPHSPLPLLLPVDPAPGAIARAVELGWRAATIAGVDEIADAWRSSVDRGGSREAG